MIEEEEKLAPTKHRERWGMERSTEERRTRWMDRWVDKQRAVAKHPGQRWEVKGNRFSSEGEKEAETKGRDGEE